MRKHRNFLNTQLSTFNSWLAHTDQSVKLKKRIKEAEDALDTLSHAKYPELTEEEVKALVVDDKWLTRLDADVHGEMDRISQSLTQRVKELAERYGAPMPQLSHRVADLEEKVNGHLERMGFAVADSILVGSGQ